MVDDPMDRLLAHQDAGSCSADAGCAVKMGAEAVPATQADRAPIARCGIVPPYLLERLAGSGDDHPARSAAATLTHDRERRGGYPTDPRLLTIHPRRVQGARSSRAATREPLTAEAAAEAPSRAIHDSQGSRTLPGVLVRAEGDPPTGDSAVTQAYDYLGATWTLYFEAYRRDSLDGKGMGLVASVHYGRQYDNAFWNGTQMVFGDGDGEVFLGFTRSIDVVGHELTHGVTQFTSGLHYRDQSGALNESVSDIFGSLVKQHALGQSAEEADWLIGAELLAPGVNGVALRSLRAPGTAYDDPRIGKDPQPAHMRDYVETSDDNGGVHINSGIPNHAFYLAAMALGGHAWEVAGQIWYDTITGDIKADCDFETFAQLTVTAAQARFGAGSGQEAAVRTAWEGVGIVVATDPGVGDGTPGGGSAARPGDGGSGPKTAPVETPSPDSSPSAPAAEGPRAETFPGQAPPPGAVVTVRRTGGLAGMTSERTIALDALSSHDSTAWQELLAGRERLAGLAAEDTHPDAYCYGITCRVADVDIVVPEPALSERERDLLERTLRSG